MVNKKRQKGKGKVADYLKKGLAVAVPVALTAFGAYNHHQNQSYNRQMANMASSMHHHRAPTYSGTFSRPSSGVYQAMPPY